HALANHPDGLFGGEEDDGKFHLVLDRPDRRMAGKPEDTIGPWIDRVDAARVAPQEVGELVMTWPPWGSRGADHGYAARLEEVTQRLLRSDVTVHAAN